MMSSVSAIVVVMEFSAHERDVIIRCASKIVVSPVQAAHKKAGFITNSFMLSWAWAQLGPRRIPQTDKYSVSSLFLYCPVLS